MIFNNKINFGQNFILAFFLYIFKEEINKNSFSRNKMEIEMDDRELFEKLEALQQAIERIEQKELLDVQISSEIPRSEENLKKQMLKKTLEFKNMEKMVYGLN